MKKALTLLFAFLMIVSAAFAAFADVAPPSLGYAARVGSAPADVYTADYSVSPPLLKKTDTLSPGTSVHVWGETTFNGQLYCSINAGNEYVRKSDLSLLTDTPVISADEGYRLSSGLRLTVVESGGVPLHSGLSADTPVLATVPVGTTVQCDAIDTDAFAQSSWMYLTYGEQSGWANCRLYGRASGEPCPMAELLPSGITGNAWIVKDKVQLLDNTGKAIQSVPKGTKLTYSAFNRSPKGNYLYVTYKGKTGFLQVNAAGGGGVADALSGESCTRTLSVRDNAEIRLYRYPQEQLPLRTIKAAAGDTLRAESVYLASAAEDGRGETWVYIKPNGLGGWYRIDEDKAALQLSANAQLPALPQPQPPEPQTDTQPTEPPHTEMPIQILPYTDLSETTTAAESTTAAAEPTTEEPFITADARFEQDTTTAVADEQPTVPTRKWTTGQIAIVFAIAAAILAVTALVSLQLVHKKTNDDEP